MLTINQWLTDSHRWEREPLTIIHGLDKSPKQLGTDSDVTTFLVKVVGGWISKLVHFLPGQAGVGREPQTDRFRGWTRATDGRGQKQGNEDHPWAWVGREPQTVGTDDDRTKFFVVVMD